MWDKIDRYRIHILGIVLFLSMMDSLLYISIGGFKLKVYQALAVFLLLPLRFVRKKAFMFFLVYNCLLGFSLIQGYHVGASTHSLMANFIKLEIFALFVLNFSSLPQLYESRKLIFQYIFWGALLSSIYGILQFLSYNVLHYVLPGNPESKILGEHLLKRVYSFFPEPNWFSLQIMLIVPVIYLVCKKQKDLFLGFSIILLALLLSMSRGAWLCMLLFFYFLFLEQKGALKVLSTIFVPIAIFVFLIVVQLFFSDNEFFYRLTHLDFSNDPSFSSRLDSLIALGNYYSFIIEGKNWLNLLLGCGMLSFQSLFWPFEISNEISFFAINSYVDIIIEHGILLTIFLLYIGIRFTRKILKSRQYSSETRRMTALIIISLMFMSAFYPLKSYISNLPILGFYIALLMDYPLGKEQRMEEFA